MFKLLSFHFFTSYLLLLIPVHDAHSFITRGRVSPRKFFRQFNGQICEYIVQSLPISAENAFPISWQTSVPKTMQISDWLMAECLRRFDELMCTHRTNMERTSFNFASDIPKNNGSIRSTKLFVLDLDETLLFQVHIQPSIPSIIFNHAHSEDLQSF